MPLTRDFRETVLARARRDPEFREGLLNEAVGALLGGEVEVGTALLRDYINAAIGFDELGRLTDKSPKSLMRMFGPNGNPQARNLFEVIEPDPATRGRPAPRNRRALTRLSLETLRLPQGSLAPCRRSRQGVYSLSVHNASAEVKPRGIVEAVDEPNGVPLCARVATRLCVIELAWASSAQRASVRCLLQGSARLVGGFQPSSCRL